jgi:hypothetical protein
MDYDKAMLNTDNTTSAHSELNEILNKVQLINERIEMIRHMLQDKADTVFGEEPSIAESPDKLPEPSGLIEVVFINLSRTQTILDYLEPAARRFLRL